MQNKYDPHIRIKFSLFNDPQFRTIPIKHRPYAYLVFICLLKFANSKTFICYPRKATICDMSGLSRTTVYRATLCLIKANIIKKKRLKSTLLYMINPKYIVGYRTDVSRGNTHVSTGNTGVSARPLLEKLTYITNIDTNKKQFSNKSSEIGAIIKSNIGNKELIIDTLAKLPLTELNQDKNNPYYVSLAKKRKEEIAASENATYISPNKIVSALNKIKKETNIRYKEKKEYNIRNGIKPWENK